MNFLSNLYFDQHDSHLEIFQNLTFTYIFLQEHAISIYYTICEYCQTKFQFLKEAGIKIWVLTGDKVETAESIGKSTGLLSQDLQLVYLTKTKHIHSQIDILLDQLYNNTTLTSSKGQKSKTRRLSKLNTNHENNTKFGLLVSGSVLIQITKDKKLTKLFPRLAIACKAVVCCRVSPKQKAEIVTLLRKTLPYVRTLAIGDGANDVNMITAAHIGIGIQGLEGSQAARAADYSIGEFKHLKKLMIVYGREAYRRNSTLVIYTFWKNQILVFPQFWLALIYGNFSGIPLYEKYMYQMFNVFYAALPIIIYAITDRQLDEKDLLDNPSLYKSGPSKIYFNSWLFILSVIKGFFHSFLISVLCSFLAYTLSPQHSLFTFHQLGTTIFISVCILVNAQILVFSYSRTFLNIIIITFSLVALLVSLAVISLFKSKIEYGMFSILLTQPFVYVVIVSLLAIVTMINYLFEVLQRILFFNFLGVEFRENNNEYNHIPSQSNIDKYKQLPSQSNLDTIHQNSSIIQTHYRLQMQTEESNNCLEPQFRPQNKTIAADVKRGLSNMKNSTKIIVDVKSPRSPFISANQSRIFKRR